jgi:hypothetical protein
MTAALMVYFSPAFKFKDEKTSSARRTDGKTA